ILASAPGTLRSMSVSSTRSTNRPPVWRAKSRLKSAVRAPPMWRGPVGGGAKRVLVRALMEAGLRGGECVSTRDLNGGESQSLVMDSASSGQRQEELIHIEGDADATAYHGSRSKVIPGELVARRDSGTCSAEMTDLDRHRTK